MGLGRVLLSSMCGTVSFALARSSSPGSKSIPGPAPTQVFQPRGPWLVLVNQLSHSHLRVAGLFPLARASGATTSKPRPAHPGAWRGLRSYAYTRTISRPASPRCALKERQTCLAPEFQILPLPLMMRKNNTNCNKYRIHG